jgi:hypothetical protein
MVLDQYFELMHPDQHKDVINRTLENTPKLLSTFLSCANRETVQISIRPVKGLEGPDVDPKITRYFEKNLKKTLIALELNISTNWRLHKHYYETMGAFALHTYNSETALAFVQ